MVFALREVFAFLFEAYEMTKQQAAWRRRLQIPSDFSEGNVTDDPQQRQVGTILAVVIDQYCTSLS